VQNIENTQKSLLKGESESQLLSPYAMFKYSIRSELTRKYYERRLRKFLDFIQFEIGTMRWKRDAMNLEKRAKSIRVGRPLTMRQIGEEAY
jgi:hypothetical protein